MFISFTYLRVSTSLTTNDTVAVRIGASTAFLRYFICRVKKPLECRQHLGTIRGMNRKQLREYNKVEVARFCEKCEQFYLAPRGRDSTYCFACQQKHNTEQARRMIDDESASRIAAARLDDKIRDEVRMPWERKYTKSMWDR
jgi:hypothetical protein